jgi:hypothetical protein
MTELNSLGDLLSSLGGICAALTIGGFLAGLMLGIATGFMLGHFGARPMMRWGFGEAQIAGCLATGVLVLGGAGGGLWAGGWGGGSLCARHAISKNYVLEDLGLKALMAVATEGRPTGDPARDGRALRELVDEAGGSLREVLEEVEQEVRAEAPEVELPAFLSPEAVSRLIDDIEKYELFEPEAMATIASRTGFAGAVAGSDAQLAAYAERLLDLSEPVRRDVLLGLYAAAISNAVATPLVTLGGPFILLFLIAGASRLVRAGGRHRLQPESGRPPQAQD